MKNEQKPLVSIITVCFNSERTIEDTILSVINQTYPNIEYIIIDGGSTDNTLDIIKRYEKYITTWISEPDEGIYDAMNKGLSISNGTYVFFLNSDDLFYSRETINQIINKNTVSYDVIYGDVILCSEDLAFVSKQQNKKRTLRKILKKTICHQAIFAKKKVFDKTGIFNTKYKIHADFDWQLKVF